MTNTLKINEIKKKDKVLFLDENGELTDFDTLEEILYSGFRLGYIEFPINDFISMKVVVETASHRTYHEFSQSEVISTFETFMKNNNREKEIPTTYDTVVEIIK